MATLFTYAVTAAGAAVVFLFHSVNQKLMDIMLGISAGVMIAASYWSLLAPAIALAEETGRNAPSITCFGFLSGGLFILLSDVLLDKKITQHPIMSIPDSESTASNTSKNPLTWKRCILLTAAVTIHNIPEGLSIGVAFGYAGVLGEAEYLTAALMLAVGIGIQNFPEGTCVAMPLRQADMSRGKSFLIGQLSGMVEPIAGVLGALFALRIQTALPLALSFSAGAMISVVCSELIPEAFRDNKRLASCGVMAGFIVMMFLDVALG